MFWSLAQPWGMVSCGMLSGGCNLASAWIRRDEVFQSDHRKIGGADCLELTGEVASHVEPRVANFKGVEDADSGANRPSRRWSPGDTQPRRKIVSVGILQASAQAPIARHLNWNVLPVHSGAGESEG